MVRESLRTNPETGQNKCDISWRSKGTCWTIHDTVDICDMESLRIELVQCITEGDFGSVSSGTNENMLSKLKASLNCIAKNHFLVQKRWKVKRRC